MLGSAYQGTHSEEEGFVQLTDLLVLTSSDQLLLILQTLFTFLHKTCYPNEEVNRNFPASNDSLGNVWLEKEVGREPLLKRKALYS